MENKLLMKKLIIILLAILLVVGVSLFFLKKDLFYKILGEKHVSEGIIEYEITYPKIDANNMVLSGMPTKAALKFKNNNTINEMSGMMGLINIAYISNQTNHSVFQSLTLFNKKYVSTISPEDMKRLNEGFVSKMEFGNNVMIIAGFKCKEAIVTLKDNSTLHVYYTNDIDIANPNWSNPFSEIGGVLMDFEMERYGVVFHMKAKTVLAQKIEESSFQFSDEYKKISYSELEKILMELNPDSQ